MIIIIITITMMMLLLMLILMLVLLLKMMIRRHIVQIYTNRHNLSELDTSCCGAFVGSPAAEDRDIEVDISAPHLIFHAHLGNHINHSESILNEHP